MKDPTTVYIKNMVCNRCIAAVQQVLEETAIPFKSVSLGEVALSEALNQQQIASLQAGLLPLGFELLDDEKAKVVAKIKNIIINKVHYTEALRSNKNLSQLLAAELHKDYSSLSKLFSEVEGITIEQYAIQQKVERIKELLVYDQLSLSEIADKLDYSSVAHLSAQFKKVTGLTPSYFKKNARHTRKPLDSL
ncbi:MAG TPA: AraC family transcriptional regulator [Chitinophagaceae bacterium]|nr:AraC family transcriptional regulator [Chitinophagaceae bacterium]